MLSLQVVASKALIDQMSDYVGYGLTYCILDFIYIK